MQTNTKLNKSKSNKDDEFYTQYKDIENELNRYIHFYPDLFKDKVILCPCDDPEWSNFTKFFIDNFEKFGIKKLISTSYAIDYKKAIQPSTLFDLLSPKEEFITKGKVFILDKENFNKDKTNWEYLKGNGDFRSKEITNFRDEADFIITNPPFSLFRVFMKWVLDGNKKFIVIGNRNTILYKDIFPLIKENKIWIGNGRKTLTGFYKDIRNQIDLYKINAEWFTNIGNTKENRFLKLQTMSENLKNNEKLRKELYKFNSGNYMKYDYLDAIDIPFTNAIPSDYKGIMGVPISFLEKYNPEQFEILDIISRYGTLDYFNKNELVKKEKGFLASINGKPQFSRILIRYKNV